MRRPASFPSQCSRPNSGTQVVSKCSASIRASVVLPVACEPMTTTLLTNHARTHGSRKSRCSSGASRIRVAEIGADQAGLYIHLMPVFGIVLSSVFLGEHPQGFHFAGIALILAGIALTTRRAALP